MSVWDEVVGQERVVDVLQQAVNDSTSMTHAWLITGPPGSGRSVAARAFAAGLQCEKGGCGECHACKTVLAGTHPDVTVLATQKVIIGIDEVRNLVSLAQLSPSQGRYRVIIIEDADRMMERTSNVLLKAIEEPPEKTVWMLCAPSAEDVITTVRSRCRHVSLRIPSPESVAELLMYRDGIAADVAMASARAAQSHIGLASRLARDAGAREHRAQVLAIPLRLEGVADAVIAAGDLLETAQEEATSSTQETDAKERAELLRSMGIEEGGRIQPALRAQVRRLEEEQKRRATRAQRDVLDRSMMDLLSLYRDVLLRQLNVQSDLINLEFAETIERLASSSTAEQTIQRMDAIKLARTRISGNVAPLLAIESMLLSLRPQAKSIG